MDSRGSIGGQQGSIRGQEGVNGWTGGVNGWTGGVKRWTREVNRWTGFAIQDSPLREGRMKLANFRTERKLEDRARI